jgi:nicotinamidase-related amidase
VRHVVVTGIAGDGCVMTTAADAHMREFEVTVPSDCCASISAERNAAALKIMKTAMKLSTTSSRRL